MTHCAPKTTTVFTAEWHLYVFRITLTELDQNFRYFTFLEVDSMGSKLMSGS